MNNHSHNLIRNTLLMFFALLIFCSISPALAAPARVAILPFDMHAEKDLTFLQEGIMDMLGSRIAYQDQVEVISKSETRAALESVQGFEGESRALLIGGKLKADYVLFGSITMFGESVSIDAKMVDVTSQKPPLPFFAQTRGMADVIPQINQFATDINAAVFGRAAPQRTVAAAPPSAGVAPSPAIPTAPVVDPRMHPEKLLQSGATPGATSQTPGQPAAQGYQAPNPAFVAIEPVGGAGDNAPTYWKSRSFKTLINGIAITDVDNDGRQETIIASENLLSIYRMENGRLIKVAEKAKTRTSAYIGVDVADINGNGTPEIYISSLGPNRSSVDSFVLEFDGTDYKMIHGGDNWFYRVARTVDRGTILMGQRMRAAENSIFYNPIQEMQWQGSDLVPVAQMLKGGKANLMGATYGDVTQSAQSSMIAYSKADRLRIYSATGEEIWEDAERTGGNMAYFNLPKVDPGQENKQFFPLRVQTADIDRNGKTEVLVAFHEELANNMLQSFRQFSKARIECKEWNGLALASKWKTQEFSGRASDFVVGDIDNDGSDELVVAVVAKEGSIIMTDAVSSIIAFDLNPQ